MSAVTQTTNKSARTAWKIHTSLLKAAAEQRRSGVFPGMDHAATRKGSQFGQPDWAAATLFETWCMSGLGILGSKSETVGWRIFNWAQDRVAVDDRREIATEMGFI